MLFLHEFISCFLSVAYFLVCVLMEETSVNMDDNFSDNTIIATLRRRGVRIIPDVGCIRCISGVFARIMCSSLQCTLYKFANVGTGVWFPTKFTFCVRCCAYFRFV